LSQNKGLKFVDLNDQNEAKTRQEFINKAIQQAGWGAIVPLNLTNSMIDAPYTRSDCLEDKPLIQFLVNRQGIIKSSGELEGEWWIWPTI